MAPGAGQPRLPCRGRRLPLLRAARLDPRAGRRAPDQPHRRDLPSRPAGRGSRARHGGRRHGTDPEHMPSAHRRYAEWTPERFRRWARAIGPNTEGLVIAVLANRPHPEQGFRTCLGILRLFRGLTPARAEAVSARAVAIGALTYKSIASILAHHLDRTQRQPESATVIDHPNVRGPR